MIIIIIKIIIVIIVIIIVIIIIINNDNNNNNKTNNNFAKLNKLRSIPKCINKLFISKLKIQVLKTPRSHAKKV